MNNKNLTKEEKQYFEKFGELPKTIGLFWDDPSTYRELILEAIKKNTPYDEREMLSKSEREDFDNGVLFF